MKKLLLSLALAGTSLSLHAQCNATITPLGNTTFCQGGSVDLVASTGTSYQWYLNGTAINGATADTLTVNIAGSYEVVVDSAGCVDTSAPQLIAVNVAPAQPGLISGTDSACTSTLYTFTVPPVPGATIYNWVGVSTQLSSGGDTTSAPSITGYVAVPQNMSQYGSIIVFAQNSCGSSQPASMPIVVQGPPQIGGSWTQGSVDISDMGGRLCPPAQHTLFPVTHGFVGGYTSPSTYQWCLDGVPIPGATQWQYTISHGGNYSVQIITKLCGTFTVPKKVYQNIPNSATVSPAGPVSYCLGNAMPLTVTFDMTGVNESFGWSWFKASYYHSMLYPSNNANSVVPDTSGGYMVRVAYNGPYGYCQIWSNTVSVTIPPPLEITQIDSTLYATPGFNSYQWYESGVPLTGSTGQSHVLTFDGIYSVEAVFSNGCIETSDTFASNFLPQPPDTSSNSNTNNNNNQAAKMISVYPNPVVGEFTLVALVPMEDKSAGVSIMDVMGKVIYQKDVEVKDGRIEQKIQLGDNIQRFGIIKVRSKGANRTLPFYKKE